MNLNKLFTEYVIRIKDEEHSFSKKEITYDPLLISHENEILSHKIKTLVDQFMEANPSQESPEITVKTKTIWQS